MATISDQTLVYHCQMLLLDIAKRERTGDTRVAIYIDDTDANILTKLINGELTRVKAVNPEAVSYWDKFHKNST